MLLQLLGGKCARCAAIDRLEFDHIDPTTVSFRIGHRLDYSVKTLLDEASKCQLLCKPCHAKKSYTERGLVAVTHGSPHMYKNNRCRCSECRGAWASYMRLRRKKYLAQK
jgi:hypothetical protein